MEHANVFGTIMLALVVALAAGLAGAQEQRLPAPSAKALIEAARAALAKGAPDDAEFLLKGVKPGEGNVDDLDFLYGSIALVRGEW